VSARTRITLAAAALGFATIFSTAPSACTTNGAKWNVMPVSYFVNPDNLDLPSGAADAAVRAGADTWALQSTAAFAFSYAGQSSQTTNTNDQINLVMFRNVSNGSAIATTYTWFSGSTLIDADIVFWDAGFRFFSGTTGCANGYYIEDISAHEFGHALGLGHTTSLGATMYPSASPCDQSIRLLDSDDLAGVLAIYGPRASQAPRVPTGLRIIGR
jgi:hypothetical protein